MKKSLATVIFLCVLAFNPVTLLAASIKQFDTTSLIKNDGTLWSWGDRYSVPTQIQGIGNVKIIFPEQFIMKEDNSFWRWDHNSSGKVEISAVKSLSNLTAIYPYWDETLALDKDGVVYYIPKQDGKPILDKIITVSGINNVVDISYQEIHKGKTLTQWVFLKKDGTVWVNKDSFNSFEQLTGLGNISQIMSNVALKNDGSVWSWTSDFSNIDRPTLKATKMSGLSSIKSINSNGRSFTAIDDQARLWYWGVTMTGFSDGTTLHYTEPKQVTSIKNVKDAFVVEKNLVVLANDGKIYTTSIQRESMPSNPQFEQIATEISQIKHSTRHMIIQKNNGSLLAWGVNKNGQLGSGDFEFMHTKPVPVQKAISVEYKGEAIQLNNGVILRNSQTFIPIRSIFEKMGAEVTWDEKNKTVQISKNNPKTVISVNFKTGETFLNNKIVNLNNKPFTINGVSYLPLRFISESLGAKVEWKETEEKIKIN